MKNKAILFLIPLLLLGVCIYPSEPFNMKMMQKQQILKDLVAKRGVKGSVDALLEKYGQVQLNKGDLFPAVVACNNIDLVEEFMQRGVNTTAIDKFGRTAYSYARTPEMKAVFLKEAIDFCYDPTTGDHALITQRK